MKRGGCIEAAAALNGLQTACGVASSLEIEICAAIVDSNGTLAGFLRMPGAFLVSGDLAIDKAWTASSFGMPTSAFSSLLSGLSQATRNGLLRRAQVTEVTGGVPIYIDEVCVGAIGISGGTIQQDEEIANITLEGIKKSIQENRNIFTVDNGVL